MLFGGSGTINGIVSAIVTLGGGATTTISLVNSNDDNMEFKKTLYSAIDRTENFNLCFEKYTYYDYYSSFKQEKRSNWDNWDNGYVYKYNNSIVRHRVKIFDFWWGDYYD